MLFQIAEIRGDKMFEKNKGENKKATVVTTKEQLKAAVNRKDSYIEVQGDLAKKMNWMAKLSKKKIALIIAAVGVYFATGAEVSAASTLAALLGAAAVVAILKGYNVEADVVNGVIRLTKN